MGFDHEKFDVYHLALDFVVYAHDIIDTLPRGRRSLADQLSRAATSVVLNLAEGTGKRSSADKRRFYVIARGSAVECAALIDVLAALRLIDRGRQDAGKARLLRIVAMLVKLAQRFEEKRKAK